MKGYYKNELARAAGVSYTTFARFIKSRSKQLRKMGVQPRCKLLPPIAVDYLCREYGIDISEV